MGILKILIVDNDPHILSLLEQTLEPLGFTTESATNGKEALKKIYAQRSGQDFPGILITDIQMDPMNGLELMKRALELDPKNTDIIYALAVVYRETPGFIGGDKKKAELYLNTAIIIDPNFTLPYLELAKLYARAKKYDEANEMLNKLLAMENPKYPADYFLKDKPKAIKLLAEIKEKNN